MEDLMLEKIPGVKNTNKLRFITLSESDLNQTKSIILTRKLNKLNLKNGFAMDKHQYCKSHQTTITPILNKVLTINIFTQKKTPGIIFDNDAKG